MNKSLKLSGKTEMFILKSAGYVKYPGCVRIDEKTTKYEHCPYDTRTIMWINFVLNCVGILSKTECPLPLPKAKEWV